MTLPEAVETLRAYNLWRRGDEPAMLSPELIGRAIDAACNAVDALIESDRMYRERAAPVESCSGGEMKWFWSDGPIGAVVPGIAEV